MGLEDELFRVGGDGDGESGILIGWVWVPLLAFCLLLLKLFIAPMALCTPGRRFLGEGRGETTDA